MENKEQSSDEKIKEVIRKLDLKAFWIGVIGLVVLIAFPIWITDHFWFDYSKTGTFGDTIGGLTAPIIGFFSALLIYLSFRAQIKANYIVQSQIEKQEKSENEKKEIEFISNLLNNLREEINEFTFSPSDYTDGNEIIYGTNALIQYLNYLNIECQNFEYTEALFYSDTKNQEYIGLLTILEKLIQIIIESKLKVADKEYFKAQLSYFFDYKLTLCDDQRITKCAYCGEDHLLLPCFLTEQFYLIDTKIGCIGVD